MAILEVQNIKKSFGKNEVLKGISFELEKGEVLTIIGSSGSGKTTLLRCLNYLEVPDNGKIVVDGDAVFNSDEKNEYTEENIRSLRLHLGWFFNPSTCFRNTRCWITSCWLPDLRSKRELKIRPYLPGKRTGN